MLKLLKQQLTKTKTHLSSRCAKISTLKSYGTHICAREWRRKWETQPRSTKLSKISRLQHKLLMFRKWSGSSLPVNRLTALSLRPLVSQKLKLIIWKNQMKNCAHSFMNLHLIQPTAKTNQRTLLLLITIVISLWWTMNWTLFLRNISVLATALKELTSLMTKLATGLKEYIKSSEPLRTMKYLASHQLTWWQYLKLWIRLRILN